MIGTYHVVCQVGSEPMTFATKLALKLGKIGLDQELVVDVVVFRRPVVVSLQVITEASVAVEYLLIIRSISILPNSAIYAPGKRLLAVSTADGLWLDFEVSPGNVVACAEPGSLFVQALWVGTLVAGEP